MAIAIPRLISRIKKLQIQADNLARTRDAVIAQIHELMTELDRAVAQIRTSKPAKTAVHAARSAKKSALKGRKVAPKYRGPGGNWSGRGLMPVWLREAIKKGKKIEDFLIKKARK